MIAPNLRSAAAIRGVPVLPGYLDEAVQAVRVYCEWCRVWHSHGTGAAAGEPLEKLTHRVAHCLNPKSPYRLGGYYVNVVGAWSRDMKRRGPRP